MSEKYYGNTFDTDVVSSWLILSISIIISDVHVLTKVMHKINLELE